MKPFTHSSHLRSQRVRGAVLAETTIVLFVLVVFFGGIQFFHAALAAKIDVQQGSRRASVYYASHHCSGTKDDGFGSEMGGAGGAGTATDPAGIDLAPEQSDVIGQAGGRPEVAGLQAKSEHTLNVSNAQRSASVTGSIANPSGGRRSPLSVTPTSESWIYCNEEAFDGNPIELAQYFFELARSQVGL